MEHKDYYKILGIDRDASTDDIKAAYHKLARKYHPDVSKVKNAEEIFKELSEAYKVLKNTKKRAAYDRLEDKLDTDWQVQHKPKKRPLSKKVIEVPVTAVVFGVLMFFSLIFMFSPILQTLVDIIALLYLLYLLHQW